MLKLTLSIEVSLKGILCIMDTSPSDDIDVIGWVMYLRISLFLLHDRKDEGTSVKGILGRRGGKPLEVWH